MKNLLFTAIQAGILASFEVMKHYQNGFETKYKEDSSPVTDADISSNKIITNYLSPLNIPILSEEGNHFSLNERNSWDKYWCIDPIDGTLEFVNKTNEFCVSIGLIENKIAKLGVIAAPAKNLFYFGCTEIGAFKFYLNYDSWGKYSKMKSIEEIIQYSISIPIKKESESYIFLKSKNFLDSKTKKYIQDKKNTTHNLQEFNMGSAIKFGLLAEGFANEYTRFSPLSFWDITAGDAIIKSAGKKIIAIESKKEIIYNSPDLKINGFYSF